MQSGVFPTSLPFASCTYKKEQLKSPLFAGNVSGKAWEVSSLILAFISEIWDNAGGIFHEKMDFPEKQWIFRKPDAASETSHAHRAERSGPWTAAFLNSAAAR